MSELKRKDPEEVEQREIPALIEQQEHEIDRLCDVLTDLKVKLGPILTEDVPQQEVECAATSTDIGAQISRKNQRIFAIRGEIAAIVELLGI